MIKKLYKNGYSRAITFSFDDGFSQDMRVISILNRYSLKATFNIMGGVCQNACFMIRNGEEQLWDGSEEFRNTFAGHEIASHSFTHPYLTELPIEQRRFEIAEDIKQLSKLAGYPVRGFASPYGDYDESIIEILAENKVCFHRTTVEDHTYSLPDDFLLWHPGPHFAYYTSKDGQKHMENFFESDKELACLYIWGHGFELSDMDCYSKDSWGDIQDRWAFFENEVCARVAKRDDVWYATNIEIYDYATAMRSAIIGKTGIENPSDETLWFEADGEKISVAPHSTKEI